MRELKRGKRRAAGEMCGVEARLFIGPSLGGGKEGRSLNGPEVQARLRGRPLRGSGHGGGSCRGVVVFTSHIVACTYPRRASFLKVQTDARCSARRITHVHGSCFRVELGYSRSDSGGTEEGRNETFVLACISGKGREGDASRCEPAEPALPNNHIRSPSWLPSFPPSPRFPPLPSFPCLTSE